jgi:redox-sensitive bicupin YhaK (pirin superfamily)
MDLPVYFPIQAGDVPSVISDDEKVRVNIFSGELLNVKGPVPSQAVVNAATLVFQQGGKISIPIPSNHNLFIYLLDGQLKVDGFGLVDELNLVHFKNDGEGIALEATQPTRVLLLSGEPLNEDVVSYGPFVMNTQTQIMEAMRDYQKGKMGVLIEE